MAALVCLLSRGLPPDRLCHNFRISKYEVYVFRKRRSTDFESLKMCMLPSGPGSLWIWEVIIPNVISASHASHTWIQGTGRRPRILNHCFFVKLIRSYDSLGMYGESAGICWASSVVVSAGGPFFPSSCPTQHFTLYKSLKTREFPLLNSIEFVDRRLLRPRNTQMLGRVGRIYICMQY